MAPLLPFEMVRARLDRAGEHLDSLSDRTQWMGRNNPYSVGITRDMDSGDHFVTASIPQDPPDEWSFLISEFTHALRAALDNLVWQLALKRTVTPFERAAFPIFIDSGGFHDNRHLIADLTPLQQTMVERSQPYHRKKPFRDPLWLLHQINNADKHRFLPVVTQPKFDLETLRFDGRTESVEVYRPKRMENGTKLARYTPGSNIGRDATGTTRAFKVQVKVYVEGSLDIRFDDALGDISGWQVIPLMAQSLIRIETIVERFKVQLSR